MGWVEALDGRVIALDTAPFIYYLEEHDVYLPLLDPLFASVTDGTVRVITSTVTLLEVLVAPRRRGDDDLVDRYRQMLLDTRGVEVHPVSEAVAETAAQLRAEHTVRTPDAIQLATAVCGHASHFLTNDRRLPSLSNVEVLLVDDLLLAE
ncbi:PIN domain-containing protein [Candidatus Poribacteria bacterium]|nr:PIN domain-containing protein [Candidatus Poribacteria bacterium]MBT5712876.1 PIN domain-containing protein [Candidatus Poribacteria bacterium]MBT7098500.1 PIN domain-containing protein [Candidatus Poribacteria bacterium]MBT7806877.1 PIN domain-containing protein [Candidatus Poribacteria bacterium]